MRLQHRYLTCFLLPFLAMCGQAHAGVGGEVRSDTSAMLLTNAAQIRALKPEQANLNLPVRLRGVMVMKDAYAVSMTLIDDTAGVYVEPRSGHFENFSRGDLIEVEGFSDPGKFAPMVKVVTARKIGEGRIPEPQSVTYDELLMGQLGAQWVEVSGVVRRSGPLAQNKNLWELWLAMGGGQLRVRLPKTQGMEAPVDTDVSLRGVCFYQFNNSRQALNPVLTVPPDERVVVRKAAPAEPYSLPVLPVISLMQFNPGEVRGHRIHVRGVVTYAESGKGFWIRDAKQGACVRTRQLVDRLAVGTEVDALGFLTRGEYTPMLEDATFQKIGVTQPPPPIRLTRAVQALEHDADLVQVEAVIQALRLAPDRCWLAMSDGTNAFSAWLPMSDNKPAPSDWLPGSRVRIMGICSVNVGLPGVQPGSMTPLSFEILLRSVADLQILQRPPWWTPEHISWVLGITVGLLTLITAGIVWKARSRLREQALGRMKSEAEFSAVWNERNRMARELHDTLAQGLGAISMQLEVVKRKLPADADARKPLEDARSLARSNLADARNAIWNMRSQVLETGDLAKALGDILRSLTEGTETHGELRVRGVPRRLAPMTENNLLRIGQESITNAARYARAKRIEVLLDFSEKQVQLSVRDDGCGFDAEHPPKSEGGFGLVGMRERAAQMHGELTISSMHGEGSQILLILPLPR